MEPTVWQIIKSDHKDEHYLQQLIDDCDQSFKTLFGVRAWIRFRHHLTNGNKLLYYLLSSACGNQTLGEEYCRLVQIDANERLSIPSRAKRITFSLLNAFHETIFDRILTWTTNSVSQFPNIRRDARFVLQMLQVTNLAFFFLNATYPDLIRRILAIRYLSTRPPNRSADDDRSFRRLLAALSFLQVILSIFVKYNLLRADDQNERETDEATSNVNQQAESNCSGGVSEKKCLLCLSPRIDPTLLECGHVFCWNCLIKWFRYKDECPTCRRAVKSNRLVYLHNYQ